MGRWEKFVMASIAAAAVTAVCLAVIRDRPAATADLAHQAAPPEVATSPAPQPAQTPPVAAVPVVPRYTPGNFVDADPKPAGYELRAWAYMDRQTGFINGSSNSASAHNSTESMIKAWIASDYLRRLGSTKPAPERLRQITGMIRDSNDQDAQAVWAADGRDAVVRRLISVCGLKNTKVWHEWWSRTQITAQDAVRMGNCIADGTAAGPRWTDYVLDEMRHVRGEGRFGIVKALPANQQTRLAIKNGWTAIGWDHDQWHVNCLGITDDWVLVVQVKYPERLGLKYGAGYCQSQAAKILSTI
jgi:hypothetical protein